LFSDVSQKSIDAPSLSEKAGARGSLDARALASIAGAWLAMIASKKEAPGPLFVAAQPSLESCVRARVVPCPPEKLQGGRAASAGALKGGIARIVRSIDFTRSYSASAFESDSLASSVWGRAGERSRSPPSCNVDGGIGASAESFPGKKLKDTIAGSVKRAGKAPPSIRQEVDKEVAPRDVGVSGSRTRKVAPSPLPGLSASILPPWSSTRCPAIVRPSPRPDSRWFTELPPWR
jgi:hypothetical protein